MKIYLVGGAVRDKLLGLPIKERDWVVVGATVEEMLERGFRQVGKDFPVFLHPDTQEEYALARRERKISPGYKGFRFDTSAQVSLEDDLQRRDLTINAMAESSAGELIDPYHGKEDLEKKILRHVSPAFAEDPVRILRLGRFLARYAHLNFQVAEETMTLMRRMVSAGEVDALVAERVWKELERALSERHPEKFFEVLHECDAMPILFPSLSLQGQGLAALKSAVEIAPDPLIRFAALVHALPEDPPNKQQKKTAIHTLCRRYRVPKTYEELAILTALHIDTALKAHDLEAADILRLLLALDVFRREKRFHSFLIACQAIADARETPFRPDLLSHYALAAKTVPVQALIAEGLEGQAFAERLNQERLKKIQEQQQFHTHK